MQLSQLHILASCTYRRIYNSSCYSWWQAASIAGRAPSYLREQCILVLVSSAVPGRRHLRSADQLLLTIPRCHGATAQKCSFSVAGPSAWNRLPTTLREAAVQLPRGSFKKDLKKYLFREVVRDFSTTNLPPFLSDLLTIQPTHSTQSSAVVTFQRS